MRYKMANDNSIVSADSLSKVIKLGSNAANLMHISTDNKDVSSMLNGMKSIANSAGKALGGLQGDLKGASKVVDKAAEVTKILGVDNITGTTIKDGYKAITDFVYSLMKVIGDLASANFANLPADTQSMAKAAMKTLKTFKDAFKKLVDFYHNTIKPKAHELDIKIKAEFKDLKADLKDLFHKHGAKDTHNHKSFKEFWGSKIDKIETKLHDLGHKHKDGTSHDLVDTAGELVGKITEVADIVSH